MYTCAPEWYFKVPSKDTLRFPMTSSSPRGLWCVVSCGNSTQLHWRDASRAVWLLEEQYLWNTESVNVQWMLHISYNTVNRYITCTHIDSFIYMILDLRIYYYIYWEICLKKVISGTSNVVIQGICGFSSDFLSFGEAQGKYTRAQGPTISGFRVFFPFLPANIITTRNYFSVSKMRS